MKNIKHMKHTKHLKHMKHMKQTKHMSEFYNLYIWLNNNEITWCELSNSKVDQRTPFRIIKVEYKRFWKCCWGGEDYVVIFDGWWISEYNHRRRIGYVSDL